MVDNFSGGQKPALRQLLYNYRYFLAATVTGILIAVIMVIPGRTALSHTFSPNSVNPSSATPILSGTTTPITPGLTIDNFSKGAFSAPVTILEYSDFQCPNCQHFAMTVGKKFDNTYVDTGKVQLTYKFMIGWGEESLRANEAAACAAEQGQYWAYYYLLMQQHASNEVDDLSVEKLQGLAQELTLDMNTFNDSLLSHKFEAYVRQDDAEGRATGVTQGPTFFIKEPKQEGNGIKQEGALSLDVLQRIIDPILANIVK